MGRAIIQLAPKAGLNIVAKIGRNSTWPKNGRGIDLVIEFSSPEGLSQALAWCLKNKKPLVSGATGLKASAATKLKKASRKIPILWSANMSLGIAVVRAMIEQFGAVADWRFTMEEIHHTKKKDKPSGTALLLATSLISATSKKWPKIKSIRKGKVPGTHQIEAHGPDETILLRHTAHDRRIFAHGAIAAARWLFDKNRPGLYDLSDLYAVD
jgi:4-hydroxy-tetrahydrodipicolinate reductase